jgi:hypothetical protein
MAGTRTAREQGLSWPSFSRIHNSLGRLGRIAIYYTLGRLGSGFARKKFTKKQERETDRQRSYNAQLDRTGLPPAEPPAGYETALRTVFAIALNTKARPTGARYGGVHGI